MESKEEWESIFNVSRWGNDERRNSFLDEGNACEKKLEVSEPKIKFDMVYANMQLIVITKTTSVDDVLTNSFLVDKFFESVNNNDLNRAAEIGRIFLCSFLPDVDRSNPLQVLESYKHTSITLLTDSIILKQKTKDFTALLIDCLTQPTDKICNCICFLCGTMLNRNKEYFMVHLWKCDTYKFLIQKVCDLALPFEFIPKVKHQFVSLLRKNLVPFSEYHVTGFSYSETSFSELVFFLSVLQKRIISEDNDFEIFCDYVFNGFWVILKRLLGIYKIKTSTPINPHLNLTKRKIKLDSPDELLNNLKLFMNSI
jgi:hypothetical protein